MVLVSVFFLKTKKGNALKNQKMLRQIRKVGKKPEVASTDKGHQFQLFKIEDIFLIIGCMAPFFCPMDVISHFFGLYFVILHITVEFFFLLFSKLLGSEKSHHRHLLFFFTFGGRKISSSPFFFFYFSDPEFVESQAEILIFEVLNKFCLPHKISNIYPC